MHLPIEKRLPLCVAFSLTVCASISAGCSVDPMDDGPGAATASSTAATSTSATTTSSAATTTGGGGGGPGASGCGFGDPCSLEQDARAYCAANHCGSEDNVDLAFCAADGNWACVCLTGGTCDRSECVEPVGCTPGADAQCLEQATVACGGTDRVRDNEASCELSTAGDFCEWLCKEGGATACLPEGAQ